MNPTAAFVVLLLLGHGVAPAAAADRVVRYDLPTMGTVGTVALVTDDSTASAPDAAAALDAFREVNTRMSNWLAGSELSRVNREAFPTGVPVSPQLAFVVELGQRVWEQSGGAFDMTVEPLVRLWGFLDGTPRIPETGAIETTLRRCGGRHVHLNPRTRRLRFDREGLRLDLGGIAKGYAVDRAADALRARGVRRALVDLSGNMVALGAPPNRDRWRVGLRDPDSEFGIFATLRLEDRAIATSGNYEQFVTKDGRTYGHILDPRSGWPAEGLDAVTVLAPTAAEADAWATALLVLGLDGARRMALEREDLLVVLVQSAVAGHRRVWAEEGLRSRLSPVASLQDRFEFWWFGADPATEQ